MKQNGLITNYRCLLYNPDLKQRSREMRNNPTPGERKFWELLLKNKKAGYLFYRQKIIYHYVVDFYSAQLKLIIEIDGKSHIGKEEYDKNRNEYLETYNLITIRYNEDDVMDNFDIVKNSFNEQLKKRERELKLNITLEIPPQIYQNKII